LSKLYKVWLAVITAALGAVVLAVLFVHRSFALTALSDLVECALWLSGGAAFGQLALRARGRMRLFWSLITLGIGFQLAYQLLWTNYEVVLRQDVPDLFTGDMVLFLNLVPWMAALALRPHAPQDEYVARLGRLDFALLLVWWFYLYVLIVIPWQYVVPNAAAYTRNLNTAYNAEKCVVLLTLAACWMTSKGQWRRLYASLFAVSLTYSTGSALANWAIERNAYYSGSLYDIPLVAAMAGLTWIGLRTRADAPEAEGEVSTAYGVWVARSGMIAVFSLPLFAAWTLSDVAIPSRIRVFRLALTLTAALGMGILVFLRQHRLDRELIDLLDHSRSSFDNLKHLQAQILESEKAASIGQLVAGAAHELNNPITAMLGYSDLLLSTRLTAEQRSLAAKIGQYVRRTKTLVASLISFARQTPTPKTQLDLNTLARTAIKLMQTQWEPLKIEVRTQFDAGLPKVLGDSNQLLQVCLQLVGNCLHIMTERGGKILTISTERQDDVSVFQIATEPNASPPSSGSPAASVADSEDHLGLTACQGILQEHRGRISHHRREDGATVLRVELPATEAAPANSKETTVPVMWQAQPSA
jgi:signal transduction histidine kinase